MNFLISNDDGIDAPGIEALENAARPLGNYVVVAPGEPQRVVGLDARRRLLADALEVQRHDLHQAADADHEFLPALEVWRANRATGRFETVSRQGISCLNEGFGT